MPGLWWRSAAGEKEAAVLIACLEGDYAQVSSLAKELRFKEYAFPQIQGTVQENLTALQGEIDALSAQTEAHQQALAALGKERDALLRGQDAAIIQRELEIGRTLLATTDATFILEGLGPFGPGGGDPKDPGSGDGGVLSGSAGPCRG